MRIKITIEIDETGTPTVAGDELSVTVEGSGPGKRIAVEIPSANAGEAMIGGSSASEDAVSDSAQSTDTALEAEPVSSAGAAPFDSMDLVTLVQQNGGTMSDQDIAGDENAAGVLGDSGAISAGPPALDVLIGEGAVLPGENLAGGTAVTFAKAHEVDGTNVADGRCQAITKTGNQCKNMALAGSMYCHVHQHN